MGKATYRPARRPRDRRKEVMALALLVFVVLIGSAAWVKANEKFVDITVDGKQITLRTLKKTVGQALAQAKVTVGQYDEVQPVVDTALSKQQKVAVIRAVPVVISADGKKTEVMTPKPTVADVLAASAVTLGEADKVKPDKTTAVTAGMTIEVIRVKESVTTSTARIPYTLQRREDSTLELGITKTIQEGQEGQKQLTYRNTYEDGKKVKSTLIATKILKQPVTKIVAYGTSGTISRGGETIRFRKAYDMTATGYTAGPESSGRYADGYTSIGLKATFGVVAVDPKVIPMRSRLYIDGYGYAIAGDVGGAIKGLRIDLCYDTVAEALKWGRRKTKVYLLD